MPIVRFMLTGQLSNILVGGLLAYVYFRGFQATMDLAEMRRTDAEAPAAYEEL